MDQHLLPALTHVLTSIPSRRDVLRGLAGAGFGLAALRAPSTGEGKKKRKHKKKKPCPPCKKRKKGKCKGVLPDGTACGECKECQGGSCVATADGTACPGGTCQGGACQTDTCPGQKQCEGVCIPLDQCCTREDCPSGNGYVCCDGLCTADLGEPGSTCVDDQDCCSGNCRISSLGALRCAATCRGRECSLDSQCCRGFSCKFGYCGGCADSVDRCTNDADCCFSACTAPPGQTKKSCLSFAGGPCEKNWDCWSCVIHARCSVTTNSTAHDVCQNGVCGCPYECCADADCAPAEFCAVDGNGLAGECMLRPQSRHRGRS